MAFFYAKIVGKRAWPIAIVAFGLYYIGSSLVAWHSGTFCSPALLKPGIDLFDSRLLLRAMASVMPPRNADFVPLVADFAHLNFSILICLIAYPLAYKFMQAVPAEFDHYFASGTAKVDQIWISEFFESLRLSAARRSNLLLAVLFGALSGLTFVFLARSESPEARRWWGHVTFGFAGYYLAVAQAVVCYYVVWGVQVLLIVNEHILRASKQIDKFHPFHQDGYYGLRPLAQLVWWEALFVFLGGLALFSTYYVGYFGLEKTFLMLISMLIFTAGTGALLAWPLCALTMQVRHLREEAIRTIEPRMQEVFGILEGSEAAPSGRESRDELSALIHLHDTLKSSRTVPFSPALLNTVVLGYGLQALILLREFYTRFR